MPQESAAAGEILALRDDNHTGRLVDEGESQRFGAALYRLLDGRRCLGGYAGASQTSACSIYA
jgi:hypothetical protein